MLNCKLLGEYESVVAGFWRNVGVLVYNKGDVGQRTHSQSNWDICLNEISEDHQ